MGAGANSSQNKALNDRAERAAGRQKDRGPAQEAIKDAQGRSVSKKEAGGAFGKEGRTPAGDASGGLTGGGGGGAAPTTKVIDVGPAKRRARKQS